MIIFLSPAKTFNQKTYAFETKPVFLNEAEKLIHKLKSISVQHLEKDMKLSPTLAQKVKHDYVHFGEIMTAAIHGYHGHQYRHFDVASLEESGFKKNIKSVYILSGLYGLLNAYDGISPYRLEMKDKTIKNLYRYWKPRVQAFIKTVFTDEVIFNLCSEEYGKLIKDIDNVITIQFFNLKNNKLSIQSMEAKRMRGRFARHLVMHPDALVKSITLDDYYYSQASSDQHTYTFIRNQS